MVHLHASIHKVTTHYSSIADTTNATIRPPLATWRRVESSSRSHEGVLSVSTPYAHKGISCLPFVHCLDAVCSHIVCYFRLKEAEPVIERPYVFWRSVDAFVAPPPTPTTNQNKSPYHILFV